MDSFQRRYDALRSIQRGIKRGFDIIAALTGLLVFSPILLLVSVLIKIETCGPVFTTQRRYGYGGTVRVIKFQTNSFTTHQNRTRMGRLLAQIGLDGLPILINVLLGEISIVGSCLYITHPKMLLDAPLFQFVQRMNMKPGITGWAQIHGFANDHSTADTMRRQINLDLFYIMNWSLLLDVRILLRALFSHRSYVIS